MHRSDLDFTVAVAVPFWPAIANPIYQPRRGGSPNEAINRRTRRAALQGKAGDHNLQIFVTKSPFLLMLAGGER